MLFQADSDQVTACESPRMERFLSVHRSTSAAVIYRLAIHLSFAMGFLSLLWTACQDEFLCLEHHRPCATIECLGFPDQPFATDVPWSLTKRGINKSDRNLKPSPPNLAVYWKELEYTSSYPQIFLARAPLACPRSSSISAWLRAVPVNSLPPYPWVHSYAFIAGCTSNHTLLLTTAFFSHFLKPRLPHLFLSTRLPLLTTRAAPNRGRKLGDPCVPLPVPASEHGSTSDSNLYRHCDINNTYLQNSYAPGTFREPWLPQSSLISQKLQNTLGKPIMLCSAFCWNITGFQATWTKLTLLLFSWNFHWALTCVLARELIKIYFPWVIHLSKTLTWRSIHSQQIKQALSPTQPEKLDSSVCSEKR